MSGHSERVRQTAVLAEGPGAFAALLEPALLAAAARDDLAPVSVAIDYPAPARPGEALTVEAWVDRATRSLIFATAEARQADGQVVATAAGVLRIVGA